MVVKDSLVHEVDVTRFLFGEEIESVQIIRPAPNPGAPDGLQDPQIAIFRTNGGRHVDVEVFVTTGVGYEVRAEVIGEHGSATIGLGQLTPGFRERFGSAYDIELQRWVDAVRSGVCAAGVRSLQSGERVQQTRADSSGVFRLPASGRQVVGAADLNPYCRCSAGTATATTSGPQR